MEIRMEKEEDFSSLRRKMKMPFPERTRYFVHSSLPSLHMYRQAHQDYRWTVQCKKLI